MVHEKVSSTKEDLFTAIGTNSIMNLALEKFMPEVIKTVIKARGEAPKY